MGAVRRPSKRHRCIQPFRDGISPGCYRLAQLRAQTSAVYRQIDRDQQRKCAPAAPIVEGVQATLHLRHRPLTPEPNLTIMVTSFTEARNYPRYDLRQIHTLAALQRVVYANRSVLRDARNLRYELNDVCRCLLALKSSDFRYSRRYDGPTWYDVYEIRFVGPTEHVDDLYIKLSLGQGCLVVNLFSFHLTRTI